VSSAQNTAMVPRLSAAHRLRRPAAVMRQNSRPPVSTAIAEPQEKPAATCVKNKSIYINHAIAAELERFLLTFFVEEYCMGTGEWVQRAEVATRNRVKGAVSNRMRTLTRMRGGNSKVRDAYCSGT